MSAPRPPARELPTTEHVELRARLVSAVRRVCPPWLRSDADDIVQQAMLRVLGGGAAVVNASYLHRVATCATIDEIRRRRSQRWLPTGEAPEVAATEAASSPERALRDQQVGESVRRCVGALPEGRRAPVALYLEGHTVAEVAKLLGISAKSAENAVYRGLDGLRACLGQEGLRP